MESGLSNLFSSPQGSRARWTGFLNSLGESVWENSYSILGTDGRLVSFGVLKGKNVVLDLGSLYSKQVKLIGSTGGTMKEFVDLVANANRYKVRVWKKFGLEGAQKQYGDCGQRNGTGES